MLRSRVGAHLLVIAYPMATRGWKWGQLKSCTVTSVPELLPIYTANEPAGFKTFEITTPQMSSTVTVYQPSAHAWLMINMPLDQVHAGDNTLLSDFLADQLTGTGPAWPDQIYTASNTTSTCSGWSF